MTARPTLTHDSSRPLTLGDPTRPIIRNGIRLIDDFLTDDPVAGLSVRFLDRDALDSLFDQVFHCAAKFRLPFSSCHHVCGTYN